MPTKGALSQIRSRISFEFIQDIFFDLISRFEPMRRTYRGLRIYAIDGVEFEMPRTDDILNHGYHGRWLGNSKQSWYPKMYLVHAYDVLSGVTKAITYHEQLNEVADAMTTISTLEKHSLTLYDRHYISWKVIKAHLNGGSHFLLRARRSSFKVVQDFWRSNRRRETIDVDGHPVHLVKVKNPRSKEVDVFVTSLPETWLTKTAVRDLYTLRWEVETSFRDIVSTLKAEQWHTKSFNGVLQELYARLWLYNYAKIRIQIETKPNKNPLNLVYRKPNLKLLLTWIMENIRKIFKGVRRLREHFQSLAKMSLETRKRRSRYYPRQLRGSVSPYEYNNTVFVSEA